MMKKLMLLLLWLPVIPATVKATGDQKAASKVEKVTVFLSGAQVTRTATVNVLPGESTITFEGLSADIDAQSVQVHADGAFTILSVKSEPNYFNVRTRLKQVVDMMEQQKVLRDKIELLNGTLSICRQEEELLSKNQVVSGLNTGLDILKLKAALDFQTERLTGLKKKEQDVMNEISQLNSELQKYNRQIADITKGDAKVTTDVIVTVSSKTTLWVPFKLSYLVHNAGWFPSYDVRAKDVKSPVNIAYKANVSQKCGEEWKGVRLTLSTGNPSVNGNKPELKPYYLNFGTLYNVQADAITKVSGTITDNTGAPVGGATVRVKGTSIASASDASGNYSIQIPKAQNPVLQFTFIGYNIQERMVQSANMDVRFAPVSRALNEVAITKYAMDSVEYKASDYKVRTNTSVDELLKKMEGFDVDAAGNITAQGRSVARIRINGKDYSGGDVAGAVKNLPADALTSIQVIDDYGDQVNLTGIKLGNPQKILNLNIADKRYGYMAGTTGIDVHQNETQTNFEFNIANPYDVPGDGKQYAVEIGNYDLSGSFQYYVAPKLNTDVFLTAMLTNFNKYNFLSGEANLFFEGTYIGKSLLDTQASGDTLNLSLGVDKNIIVTRTLQKTLTQRQVIGSNTKETKDWVIEIKNKKSQPVNLLVEDQVPVSQNTAIEVERQEVSGAKINDTDGKAQWTLNLAPSEDKKEELKYQVKYPKNQTVIVL